MGSATLWVYSTLMLQVRVPNTLQGRMFALEMAFCTVAETTAGIFPGVAIDDLHLSVQATAAVMAGNAAVMTVIWLLLYLWYVKKGDEKNKGSYEPLDQQELGGSAGPLEKSFQQD